MTIQSSYIFLENISFYAYHGVLPQETVVGNEFLVNLKLKVNVEHAAQTDEIENTVSYADVYDVLKEEMIIPSKLLEHVCGRMAKRLFDEFPAIDELNIKLSKRHPPMSADIDSAGVEMICKK